MKRTDEWISVAEFGVRGLLVQYDMLIMDSAGAWGMGHGNTA